MSLIQMSVLGGVLILLIVVVRSLALHRLPKAAFLVLWEVTALRLLLPFSVRLPFGLPTPIKHLAVAGEYLTAAVPTKPVSAGVPSAAPTPESAATHSVLSVIWLVGFTLMAAYFVVCYVRAKGRFRTSCPDNTPAVQKWLADRKLHRPLEVRQSDRVSSPLTYGILRPVILLPKDMERGNETALAYILTHEFIHVRRFDAATKLLFAAVLCVHWFNPLAWVMYVLANRDLELSCDECVMDTLSSKEKAPYALTLIAMVETQSQYFSIQNHFSKLAIEERIEAIMKYKKASVLAMALAVALVFGTTIAFAASAQADSTPIPSGQDSTLSGYIESDVTIMSYVNPNDEKTYYSFDGGKTFAPLTDEELAQRFPTPKVEWWTYDEYAAWLENEKVQLQAMLGEKGWTGGRGDFVWTQEIIDETIAMYEKILQEIKEGKLYSKSVDGDDSVMLSSGDSFVSFKEDGQPAGTGTGAIQTATYVQPDNCYFGSVEDKAEILTYSPPDSNIIYVESQAELDEHFRALEANEEKGLDRYAGFEAMYADIDTTAPVIYVVK